MAARGDSRPTLRAGALVPTCCQSQGSRLLLPPELLDLAAQFGLEFRNGGKVELVAAREDPILAGSEGVSHDGVVPGGTEDEAERRDDPRAAAADSASNTISDSGTRATRILRSARADSARQGQNRTFRILYAVRREFRPARRDQGRPGRTGASASSRRPASCSPTARRRREGHFPDQRDRILRAQLRSGGHLSCRNHRPPATNYGPLGRTGSISVTGTPAAAQAAFMFFVIISSACTSPTALAIASASRHSARASSTLPRERRNIA